MLGWLLLGLLALGLVCLAGYILSVYNDLVAMRKSIGRNWDNIDIVLRQRCDELPGLLELCEGPLRHQPETLAAVAQARARVDQAHGERARAQAQNDLSAALKGLLAAAAASAELKADAGFLRSAARLAELEEQIATRREFLNEVVNSYNVRVEQSSDRLIARLGNFKPASLWPTDPEPS